MAEQFRWTTDTPESQGLRSAALEAMWANLATRQTTSLLVIRNDRILFERYAADWGPDRPHYTASLAKALVGGLSLLLAMDAGLVDPDRTAATWIPQWRTHPHKSAITLRHLATHSSGLEDAEASAAERARILAAGNTRTAYHVALPGWKGAFWRREPDPFTPARDEAPVLFAPGTAYAYSNPGMAMLAYAITAALQPTRHRDVRTLLRERVMEPIGVDADAWSIGYGQTYQVDDLPLVANWGGGSFTPRAVARVARLLLHKGEWNGVQLINPARVQDVLADAGTPRPDRGADPAAPAPALGWYTNADGTWPTVPRDAFAGAGAGNQVLLVVPSHNLIVVRNGEELDGSLPSWQAVAQHLFAHLMDSFARQPPYPPSPAIADARWAPPSQIARLATGEETRDGSDNWPLTWGEDGHLYTAYGDGYGFAPRLGEKLGLGFAVVTGDPATGITGLNIRSTAENREMGRRGRKACGLLMVDGTLYMWVRNVDGEGRGAQLAWSQDEARTWTWCDWHWAEFGYPTFINFGRNHRGARDNYVYVVTPDGADAYAAADRFILMRVPRDRITERGAYEFFVETGAGNRPVWTANLDRRGPVFAHPGGCARSGISYNPGLGRYLWWQQLWGTGLPTGDAVDMRFRGGFGVYDAPEPWGPWTTVYFTERWDVGPGEAGCFPTKWMSSDGCVLHLVFSGNDNFSVRQLTLTRG